jgi:hypothetical protein|nr:MAG TPA: hypothetical protein [Caudoviricetes sp.]DAY19748.1 MAG TPA: hypothetical protein [Caudoviricetes sp.]
MKLTKNQIQQQREAIDGLYELVKEAPASERKDSAMAYCEGCIAACDLGLKVLNGKKAEDTPKAEDAPKVEEQATTEEKPKRKRVSKKKEAPVEETLPVEEDTVVEETLEDDDLDDLL